MTIGYLILILQHVAAKVLRKKSWAEKADDNLTEYESRREGW